jgi:hypothetical protein
MKYFVCSVFCTLLLSGFLRAQTNLCESGYMPFHQGTSFELTSYNQKGKLTSSVQHSIKDVASFSGGYRATVETEVMDDKGKSLMDGQYTIDCDEDGITLDVSSLLNSQTLTALSAMEVAVSGEGLFIPNTLHAGQTLPDASMHMQASMNGMTLFKLNMNITDRSVTASGSVTTPAGTFDCMKIVQTTSIDGLGKSTYNSASWFAKGVGMVRTENYDKKGALESYTELTQFGQK